MICSLPAVFPNITILQDMVPSGVGIGVDTVVDTGIRESMELAASQCTIDAGTPLPLHTLLRALASDARVGLSSLTITPYKYLVYNTDSSHFDWHKDSAKSTHMIATIVVARRTGGPGEGVLEFAGGSTEDVTTDTAATIFYCTTPHRVTPGGGRESLVYNVALKPTPLSDDGGPPPVLLLRGHIPTHPHVFPLSKPYSAAQLSEEHPILVGADRQLYRDAVFTATTLGATACFSVLKTAHTFGGQEEEEENNGDEDGWTPATIRHPLLVDQSFDGAVSTFTIGDHIPIVGGPFTTDTDIRVRVPETPHTGTTLHKVYTKFTGNEGVAIRYQYSDYALVLAPPHGLFSYITRLEDRVSAYRVFPAVRPLDPELGTFVEETSTLPSATWCIHNYLHLLRRDTTPYVRACIRRASGTCVPLLLANKCGDGVPEFTRYTPTLHGHIFAPRCALQHMQDGAGEVVVGKIVADWVKQLAPDPQYWTSYRLPPDAQALIEGLPTAKKPCRFVVHDTSLVPAVKGILQALCIECTVVNGSTFVVEE